MRIQSNIEEVLVCKDVAETAGRETHTWDFLAEGETAVFLPGGTIATATTGAAAKTFRIGYKSTNGELIMSDVIDPKTVKNYRGKINAAPAEQVTYVGYNGTSGSIQAINSNRYIVTLNFENDTVNGNMDRLVKYGTYTSDSAATSLEVASGLALNLYNNLKNELEYRVKVERVSSGAQTAVPTGCDNFTFTNGSKYFTVTDIDDATGTAALVVGDALVIGSGTTVATYVIASIDAVANIGTFDVPFAGTSATIADGSLKVVVKAAADAASWGLKLTGVAKPWKLGWYPFNKVKFVIGLDDCGTTTVTYTTAATIGTGNYESVAEAEWFAQGNEGGMSRYRIRGDGPAYEARKDAESGHYYSTLSFTHKHEMQSEIGPVNNSPKSVVLFLNTGATAGQAYSATSFSDADTGVVVVLDAIMVAAGTGTAQTGNL